MTKSILYSHDSLIFEINLIAEFELLYFVFELLIILFLVYWLFVVLVIGVVFGVGVDSWEFDCIGRWWRVLWGRGCLNFVYWRNYPQSELQRRLIACNELVFLHFWCGMDLLWIKKFLIGEGKLLFGQKNFSLHL